MEREMESKIQSMYDYQVWNLVDPTSHINIGGCKWNFKKKTNMYGNVHTFMARLVVKGYSEAQGVNYEETFLPIHKIKSTRILLSIVS